MKALQLDFLLDDRIRTVVRAELVALLGSGGVVAEKSPSLIRNKRRPGWRSSDSEAFLALLRASGLLEKPWEGTSKDLQLLITSTSSKLTPEQRIRVPAPNWIGQILWALHDKYGETVFAFLRRTARKGAIWRISVTAMTASDGKVFQKGRRSSEAKPRE